MVMGMVYIVTINIKPKTLCIIIKLLQQNSVITININQKLYIIIVIAMQPKQTPNLENYYG